MFTGFALAAIGISCLLAQPSAMGGEAVIFSDDFEPEGASPLWGNEVGQWTAGNGVYWATMPSNYPNANSSLPFQLGDLTFEVQIHPNNMPDGGIWFRSAPTNDSIKRKGILLVIGTASTAYSGFYWHVVDGQGYGPAHNAVAGKFDPTMPFTLRVEVQEDLYSVYVNDDPTPATTFSTAGVSPLAVGQVSLYRFQHLAFDNVVVSVPQPTIASASITPGTSSTGGALTLTGTGLLGGTSVSFRVNGFELTAPQQSVVTNATGTQLIVAVPPLPPGCDCGVPTVSSLPVNVVVSNGSGQVTASLLEFLGAPLSIPIDKQFLQQGDNVQSAINLAPPGRCLVLHSDSIYPGPLTIGPTRKLITLTSDAPDAPGLTTVKGTYQGGAPPSSPTLAVNGAGPGVCISGLSFILGNSGVEVSGSTDVLFNTCKFDDNVASGTRGGGATVSSGAFPTFFACDVLVNSTAGSGGGIRIDNASARVLSSRILGNDAAGSGGGLYLANTPETFLMVDSIIEQNSAGSNGGGIFWGGGTQQTAARGTLLRSEVVGNAASNGAGVFVDKFVSPALIDNAIGGNSATELGGGVHVAAFNFNEFLVCGNTLFGNEGRVGGAIALLNKARCVVEYNLLYCNSAVPPMRDPERPEGEAPPYFAGGVYVLDATPALLHNTIVNNVGFGGTIGEEREVTAYDQSGGVHGESLGTGFIQVWHNVLVGNDGWELYSDIPLERDGVNVQTNMAFDPAGDDAAILLYSPNTFAEAGVDNLAGVDPLFASAPDQCDTPELDPTAAFAPGAPDAICSASDGCSRGAVEVLDCGRCAWTTCAPVASDDCDGSGVTDVIEFALGVLHDLDFDGVPDECAVGEVVEGDLNGDGVVDGSDLGLLLGAWGGAGGDLNRDGATDGADLGILLGAWMG